MTFITDYLLAFIVLLVISQFLKLVKKLPKKEEIIQTTNSITLEQKNISIEFSIEIVQNFEELQLIGNKGEFIVFKNASLILKSRYEVNWYILRRRLAILLNAHINQFSYFYYLLMLGNKLSVSVGSNCEIKSTKNKPDIYIFKYKATPSSWFRPAFGQAINDIDESRVFFSKHFFLATLFKHFEKLKSLDKPQGDLEHIEINSTKNHKTLILLKNTESTKEESHLSKTIMDRWDEKNIELSLDEFRFKINNVTYRIDNNFSVKKENQINSFHFLKI